MPTSNAEQTVNDALTACRDALARGAWAEARACFEAAVRGEETPEALEGLGMAAWWQDDATVTFAARERAYHLYRQYGDCQGAARLATYLAYDYYSFRGEHAIATGWFQRAHRLLEGFDLVPEQGLLAIYEGALALLLRNDTATARRLSTQAAMVGRTLGVIDLDMLALALEGLARVSAGDIAQGMRCLDESTTAAVSGEMTDPDACASACCFLIYACERVRDYDRAAQWCTYVQELAKRWNYSLMFSLCRTHYAGILIWRGAWAEAEATLLAATNDLVATRPAEAADGLIRLADLRRPIGCNHGGVRADQAVGLDPEIELRRRGAKSYRDAQPVAVWEVHDRAGQESPVYDHPDRSCRKAGDDRLSQRIRRRLGQRLGAAGVADEHGDTGDTRAAYILDGHDQIRGWLEQPDHGACDEEEANSHHTHHLAALERHERRLHHEDHEGHEGWRSASGCDRFVIPSTRSGQASCPSWFNTSIFRVARRTPHSRARQPSRVAVRHRAVRKPRIRGA